MPKRAPTSDGELVHRLLISGVEKEARELVERYSNNPISYGSPNLRGALDAAIRYGYGQEAHDRMIDQLEK